MNVKEIRRQFLTAGRLEHVAQEALSILADVFPIFECLN